jgi:hypothetical protein
MLDLATNASLALAAFGLVTLLLHVFLVWLFPQTAGFWKASDYLWLSLAAIGLFSSTGDARRLAREREFASQVALTSELVDRYLESVKKLDAGYCLGFQRHPYGTPYTPKEISCQWFNETRISLSKWLSETKAALNSVIFASTTVPDLPEISRYHGEAAFLIEQQTTPREAKEDIHEVMRHFERYGGLRAEWARRRALTGRSNLEGFAVVVSPLSLICGLALRTTKVTAELRLQRTGAKQALPVDPSS